MDAAVCDDHMLQAVVEIDDAWALEGASMLAAGCLSNQRIVETCHQWHLEEELTSHSIQLSVMAAFLGPSLPSSDRVLCLMTMFAPMLWLLARFTMCSG